MTEDDPFIVDWAAEHRKRIEALLVKQHSIVKDESGYYMYWPVLGGGALSGYELRVIVDILQEKNRDWHTQLMKELKNA